MSCLFSAVAFSELNLGDVQEPFLNTKIGSTQVNGDRPAVDSEVVELSRDTKGVTTGLHVPEEALTDAEEADRPIKQA